MDTEIPFATTYHFCASLFGLHKLLQISWNGFLYVQVVSKFGNLVFVWVTYICRKTYSIYYMYLDFLCNTVQDLYDLGQFRCSFAQPQPTKYTLVKWEYSYFQSFLISCMMELEHLNMRGQVWTSPINEMSSGCGQGETGDTIGGGFSWQVDSCSISKCCWMVVWFSMIHMFRALDLMEHFPWNSKQLQILHRSSLYSLVMWMPSFACVECAFVGFTN